MGGSVYALSAVQGKNVTMPEFAALGNSFAKVDWALPGCEEYKNDLLQPDFLTRAVPPAQSQALAIQDQPKVIDPNSPATDAQWARVNKMAPWLTVGL